MFEKIKKSKQLAKMMGERAGDYLNLVTIEAKMQGAILAKQAVGYAIAALFGLLAVVFLGIAVIVSFWETDYRILAAWLVFLAFGAGAGAGIFVARKHATAAAAFAHVREEFQRDVDLIKESL
ncbi:phage holin family protein [Noviherbaspirillum suwonense]|nr:phage holin family protein [Noviherbaspirillum suwonense]